MWEWSEGRAQTDAEMAVAQVHVICEGESLEEAIPPWKALKKALSTAVAQGSS